MNKLQQTVVQRVFYSQRRNAVLLLYAIPPALLKIYVV